MNFAVIACLAHVLLLILLSLPGRGPWIEAGKGIRAEASRARQSDEGIGRDGSANAVRTPRLVRRCSRYHRPIVLPSRACLNRECQLRMKDCLKGREKTTMNVEEATLQHDRQEYTHVCAAKSGPVGERWLVAQAKSGQPSAFGALYECHQLRTYRAAFRILRDRQDAE